MTLAEWWGKRTREARIGMIIGGLMLQVIISSVVLFVLAWSEDPASPWVGAMQSLLGLGALTALLCTPLIVGILLVRGRHRMLLRWWIAAAAAALAVVVTLHWARDEADSRRAASSCKLKLLQFENDSVADAGHSWWPPYVDCRYGWGDFPDTIERHWHWGIYWPVAVAIVAITVTSLTVLRTVRALRGAPATPPKPTAY